MRKIKFRAWDGEIMFQDVFFTKGNNRLFSIYQYDHKELCEHVLTIDKDALHLMQYTGLKDKHGKELYEGDILRGNLIQETKYKIVFENGSFMARYIFPENMRGTYGFPMNQMSEIELIGNIYENPIK